MKREAEFVYFAGSRLSPLDLMRKLEKTYGSLPLACAALKRQTEDATLIEPKDGKPYYINAYGGKLSLGEMAGIKKAIALIVSEVSNKNRTS